MLQWARQRLFSPSVNAGRLVSTSLGAQAKKSQIIWKSDVSAEESDGQNTSSHHLIGVGSTFSDTNDAILSWFSQNNKPIGQGHLVQLLKLVQNKAEASTALKTLKKVRARVLGDENSVRRHRSSKMVPKGDTIRRNTKVQLLSDPPLL